MLCSPDFPGKKPPNLSKQHAAIVLVSPVCENNLCIQPSLLVHCQTLDMSPHACCNCSVVLLAVVLLVAVQLQTPVAVTGGAGAVLWLVAHHLHGPAVAFLRAFPASH